MLMKTRILVLCTGNSCRSQMAHGYLEQMGGDKVEVYSAGVETHGLNPGAIAIMAEDGLNIAHHTSNHVDEYKQIEFDHVITVCDHARERCPWFPSIAMLHHENFPDPAKATGTDAEVKQAFEHTRNLIKVWCASFVQQYINSQ
jgi:arsenate reductase